MNPTWTSTLIAADTLANGAALSGTGPRVVGLLGGPFAAPASPPPDSGSR